MGPFAQYKKNLMTDGVSVTIFGYVMPKCGRCGFAHALPTHCVNCGCEDPFRAQRILRALLITIVALTVPVCAFYLLQRAQELQDAERRAAAVGILDVEPTAAPVLPRYRQRQ